MAYRASVEEIRERLSDIVKTLRNDQVPVIIEENGQPCAVLISTKQFDEYGRLAKEDFLRIVDEIQQRNRNADPDEVYREVTEIVEEVRQERYERQLD